MAPIRDPNQVGQPPGLVLWRAARSKAFGDDEHRAGAFAQGAEMRRPRLHRRLGHLAPDLLDARGSHQVDLLDAATRRDVDAPTPPQLVHLIGELAPIAREADGVERS